MSHVIPKRKAPIVLQLVDGRSLRGSLYLDYIDVIHRGEQTLLDKLNDDYPWLPLSGPEGGSTRIVNRAQIVTVEPDGGLTPELVRRENSPVFRREQVTIELPEARCLTGKIAMDLPDEFSRVSDFLNFPQNFFAVETEEGPVLVAKAHVLSLTPHERPPTLSQPADTEIEERA